MIIATLAICAALLLIQSQQKTRLQPIPIKKKRDEYHQKK